MLVINTTNVKTGMRAHKQDTLARYAQRATSADVQIGCVAPAEREGISMRGGQVRIGSCRCKCTSICQRNTHISMATDNATMNIS